MCRTPTGRAGAGSTSCRPQLKDDADRRAYEATLNRAFETYARWIEPLQRYFPARNPQSAADSDAVCQTVIRAKALDTLRGLLPAATRSNVGICGSGQAYEMLLLRMHAHPLAEAREVADLMLRELRRVIPAFLQRSTGRTAASAGATIWRRERETRERCGR